MIESIVTSVCPILAEAPAPTGPGGIPMNLIVMVFLFIGMWFLLIAPQRKRQKEHAKMLENLVSGDEIMTNGGIFGTITNVKEDRFIVKIAENTKIEVSKASVQAKVSASGK